jgi:membrane-bound lytic murein transglycosylase MltF
MMARCFACLLALALAAGHTQAPASDVFYTGEEGESQVFTNIPSGEGFAPLDGFDDGSGTDGARPALLRTRAFDDLIESTGRQYGVHPALIRAIIQVESAYDPIAVSPKGARGLMQLMPATAKRYGIHNLFDPVENVRAGVRHLLHLTGLYGEDLNRVLAAYNAGEEAVRRYNGIPRYDETQRYVRKVKQLYTGPIRLKVTEAEEPEFFTYEDEQGTLHVSDVPIQAQLETQAGR